MALVAMLALMPALIAVVAGGLLVGRAQVAVVRTNGAADLSALAAATSAPFAEEPCRLAEAVAAAHGSSLAQCEPHVDSGRPCWTVVVARARPVGIPGGVVRADAQACRLLRAQLSVEVSLPSRAAARRSLNDASMASPYTSTS